MPQISIFFHQNILPSTVHSSARISIQGIQRLMKPTILKNPHLGYDAKQAKTMSLRHASPAQKPPHCSAFYWVYLFWLVLNRRATGNRFCVAFTTKFNGCRTPDSENILALKLQVEHNTILFTAVTRSVCSLLCII